MMDDGNVDHQSHWLSGDGMTAEEAFVTQARELGRQLELLTVVADTSPLGVYVALTASGAIYVIDLTNPDVSPTITRHRSQGELLHDGEPLPGVHGCEFDALTGVGRIAWWKDNPEHYDFPGLPYLGTDRATSRVLLVARVRTPDATPPDDIVTHLRALTLAAGDRNLAITTLGNDALGRDSSGHRSDGPD